MIRRQYVKVSSLLLCPPHSMVICTTKHSTARKGSFSSKENVRRWETSASARFNYGKKPLSV